MGVMKSGILFVQNNCRPFPILTILVSRSEIEIASNKAIKCPRLVYMATKAPMLTL